MQGSLFPTPHNMRGLRNRLWYAGGAVLPALIVLAACSALAALACAFCLYVSPPGSVIAERHRIRALEDAVAHLHDVEVPAERLKAQTILDACEDVLDRAESRRRRAAASEGKMNAKKRAAEVAAEEVEAFTDESLPRARRLELLREHARGRGA